MNRISDNLLLRHIANGVILSGGGLQTAWIDMRGSDSAMILINAQGAHDNARALIELRAAEDDTGLNEETFKVFPAFDIPDETGDQYDIVVEIRAEDLPEGKPFLLLQFGEVTGLPAEVYAQCCSVQANTRKKYSNFPQQADVRLATWED